MAWSGTEPMGGEDALKQTPQAMPCGAGPQEDAPVPEMSGWDVMGCSRRCGTRKDASASCLLSVRHL